jgi:hypothetical protein
MKNLVENYAICAAGIKVNRPSREGDSTTTEAHNYPNVRHSGEGRNPMVAA